MMSKAPLTPISLIQYLRQNSSHSRRELLTAIVNGHVSVNDIVTIDSTALVDPSDQIRLNNTLIEQQSFMYYQFHKPIGILSTMDDPNMRSNLKTYLKKFKLPKTLKPCGRLDKDSSGLLLFSNDGHFIHTILHPSFNVPKQYYVKLSKPLSNDHKQQLSAGIFLDDGPISIHFKERVSSDEWIIEISIGRNRIIRRAFDYFQYTVITLHRISIGPFQLNNLKSGHFEPVSSTTLKLFNELDFLK